MKALTWLRLYEKSEAQNGTGRRAGVELESKSHQTMLEPQSQIKCHLLPKSSLFSKYQVRARHSSSDGFWGSSSGKTSLGQRHGLGKSHSKAQCSLPRCPAQSWCITVSLYSRHNSRLAPSLSPLLFTYLDPIYRKAPERSSTWLLFPNSR